MDNHLIENLQPHILSHFPVAVYTTDAQGLLTFYNQKAAELWGRSPRLGDPSETAFSGAWKLYQPDDAPLPHDRSPVAVALKYQKEPCSSEICVQRPDKTKLTVAAHVSLIFAEDGTLAGAVNVLYDITQYKKMEETGPRLAALVESSTDAIIGKDLSGIIHSWNRGATDIFGYPEQEALGRNIRFIIPQDRQQEEDMILARIRKGEKLEPFETIRLRKDHQPIPVSVTISPIRNAAGQIVGASKIARDISLTFEAREKVRQYTEELKHINTAKDNFIAMTSHELKTPLTVLKATLQFLDSEIPPDTGTQWQALIGKSLSQVERLNVIASNLIDISKMEVGKFSFHFTSFPVRDLLDECIDNILLGEASHPVTRVYQLDDVTLHADRIRIGQVVNNLLSNALKYSPDETPIIVHGYMDGPNLIVRIADTGPGIPDSETQKVFDIFFRSEQTRPVPGMGVGLYLSQQIIVAHQGKLWVESKIGKGSTFFISLPLEAQAGKS